MVRIIEDVIAYVRHFKDKGFNVEYKHPENPELVLVHLVPNRAGVVVVEANQKILNQIREGIKHN